MTEYTGEFDCHVSNYRVLSRDSDCVSQQKSQVQKALLTSVTNPEEHVKLHLFLGKEAKEGNYKARLVVGTSIHKDLELSAHCIYREGMAIDGKCISFGGYRATFTHFEPSMDHNYVLYVRFI